MHNGRDTTKGKACQKNLFLHPANGANLYNRGVTNNTVIRRPAGEGDVWPSQEFDCRFNERRDTKFTGDTKDHSRMDHVPKELTPEVIQHIPIQIEDGPLP